MSRLLLITFAAALAGRPEIIDRIAVSVANQVITTDQIDEEVRVTAYLNHTKPDLGSAERKKAAERLIEQTLVRREMDFSHYPLPPLSDADAMVRQTIAQQPDYASYGITEDDLRRHLWWQITLLKFIDERFRPSVEVSRAEVRAHYNEEVAKWREQGVNPIPSFEESRDAMEKALIEERVTNAMDRWLGDARTQVDIRFRKGAFE